MWFQSSSEVTVSTADHILTYVWPRLSHSVASAVSSLPMWKRTTRRQSLVVKGQAKPLKKQTPEEQETPAKAVPFHRSLLVKPKTKSAQLSVDRWTQATESNEVLAKINDVDHTTMPSPTQENDQG